MAVGRRLQICATCLTKGWERASENPSEPSTKFEIPGYEITGELARGGMGVVYKARQRHPARDVAVKMLMPQVALDNLRERFRIEAKVMADLVHPAIMPIYQYGEQTGVPWISMALCHRGSLAERKGEYAGKWKAIAELMETLAEAVAFAHARGVLHRDLKPGNVLFDDEKRVFLSDFGLAKIVSEHSDLTQTISLVGTPHYIAPELINNASQATTASDIYALGAILYELMSGKVPFDGLNLAAILKSVCDDPPASILGAPRDLATIALKCLEKEPARRYATAQQLADDLRRWLHGEPVQARRMGLMEKLLYWGKRQPALAAVSGLLVTAVVVGGAVIVAKNQALSRTLQQSLLNEARGTRMAALVQRRESTLEAVRAAAKLGSSPELEAEAASLLALPSMRMASAIPVSSTHFQVIPDESMVHAADYRDGSTTKVMELATQKVLASLPGGQAAWGGQHAFSPDGNFLVYDQGAESNTVVYEWRTGKRLLGPLKPRRISPRFSPDGRHMAVGLEPSSIEVYDLTKPEAPPKTWASVTQQPPEPAGYSPDGRWLLVKKPNGNRLTVMAAEVGVESVTLGSTSDPVITSAAWSGDSQSVLVGSYTGQVRSWITTNHQSHRIMPAHAAQVYGSAIHPSGQLALSSGFDGRTWIIDWISGRALGMEAGNSFMTRFSLDGTKALLHDSGQSQLRIYDVDVPKVCRQFTRHSSLGGYRPAKGSWCAEVSPDGRFLAAAYAGETSIYERSTSRYLGVIKHGGGNTLAWAGDTELWLPEGNKLYRCELKVREDGLLISTVVAETNLKGKLPARLAVQPKADRWVLTMEDSLCYGKVSDSSEVHQVLPTDDFPASGHWNTTALSADGRSVFVGTEYTGLAAVYDLEEQRWLTLLDVGNPAPFAWFSPDGSSLWVGTWMEHKTLDTRSWKSLTTLADRTEPGSMGMIQGSEDGRLVVTLDGMSVVLRHGQDGQPFLRLRHPTPLTAGWLALTPNGRWLTFSGLGHVQQVWDLARLEVEMKKLGLAWRGPHLGATHDFPPIHAFKSTTR